MPPCSRRTGCCRVRAGGESGDGDGSRKWRAARIVTFATTPCLDDLRRPSSPASSLRARRRWPAAGRLPLTGGHHRAPALGRSGRAFRLPHRAGKGESAARSSVGITRGFMSGGAPRVIASSVEGPRHRHRSADDEVLPALASRKLSPAEALGRPSSQCAASAVTPPLQAWAGWILRLTGSRSHASGTDGQARPPEAPVQRRIRRVLGQGGLALPRPDVLVGAGDVAGRQRTGE